jgi:para-nitrobenzyl esterase
VANNSNQIVETDKGKVRGAYSKGLYVFNGIRYAAPPVGALRWMPPGPAAPWQGIFEARDFGPVAPQNPRVPGILEVPGFDMPEPQSEDCLYLNIRTPGLDAGKRPVMVWLHGGAFTIGSGSQPSYRGEVLAARGDVVVVTINYRLGLLGFLNLNVATDGGIPSTGNEGLLDQIAALQWVRDNINAFGGDPGNVTVFGESAGAMSIGCLMAMPKARGLFHKAILESGTGSMARPLNQCAAVAKRFLEITGVNSNDIDGIRSLSVDRILAAQEELTLMIPGSITPVAPVIDGDILPETAIDAIRKGSASEVPTLIGNNLEESKLFNIRHPEQQTIDEATLVRHLQSLIPAAEVPRLLNTYRTARSARGELVTPPEILSAVQTDIMFHIPAIHVAEAQCRNGQPAYSYIFTWKSPALNGALGACHALEIGFVFGTYEDSFCGAGEEVETLSAKMQDAWLRFARMGNPSCASLGDWPPYCDKRKTMLLGPECHVVEAPYDEERRLWETITDIRPAA